MYSPHATILYYQYCYSFSIQKRYAGLFWMNEHSDLQYWYMYCTVYCIEKKENYPIFLQKLRTWVYKWYSNT